MFYSIGEVASNTGITISTLRYYDREGMFPAMKRSEGGIRVFTDAEVNTLRVIECLKTAGMSIKDIKRFLLWCQEGDASLEKRRDMFHKQLEAVHRQMEALTQTMHTLEYKCWYYDTALAYGTEERMKTLPEADIPEKHRLYRL